MNDLLYSSEVNDFTESLKELGYQAEDFKLQHDFKLEGAGVLEPAEQINVKRISANIEKTYNAGWGTSWPADFHSDLEKGFFGQA